MDSYFNCLVNNYNEPVK